MKASIKQALENCLTRMLVPMVRLLLHYEMTYDGFTQVLKRVYVDVAMMDFTLPGKKPTISRASVITGLSRKEVLRVTRQSKEPEPEIGDESLKSYNRAARVIRQWIADPRFADDDGQPAALQFEGGDKSLSDLVKAYSGDITARTILDEMESAGSVEILENGRIRPTERAYVPTRSEVGKISILGSDVSEMIETIAHNLKHSGGNSRLQLKVSYDNLPTDRLQPFRLSSTRDSRRLLEQFSGELAQLDRDTNPESQGTGRSRAGIAIFYFEESLADGDDHGSE